MEKKLSTITVADDIYKKAKLKLNLTNDIQIFNHQNPDETPHANTFKCNKCEYASDQKNDLKTHVYLDHQLRANKLKSEGKMILQIENSKEYHDKIKKLTVQGNFLRLLEEEKQSITWKSAIYSVPKGVMAWASRAITDSLSTPANLSRWKKIVDPSCRLCQDDKKVLGTLHHILNNCPKMLARYQWRHDGILLHLVSLLKTNIADGLSVYADLEGFKVNGGTIPANILVTSHRPDLVIIGKRKEIPEILLIELTCPFESNIKKC